MSEISKIRERAAAATEGPWEFVERNGDYVRRKLRGGNDVMILALNALGHPDPPDHDFIVNSRMDIPNLLAGIDAYAEDLNEHSRKIFYSKIEEHLK